MILYCCHCGADVQATLITGRQAYPHRRDLAALPFWRHDACGNHVGCHHKTRDRTRPLGSIPGPAMRIKRSEVHRVLDPLWQRGGHSRHSLYARLSEVIGREFHTAELRTPDEADRVLATLNAIQAEPRT